LPLECNNSNQANCQLQVDNQDICICPIGWRIPNGNELANFINLIGYDNIKRGGYGFLEPNKFFPEEGHWWLNEQGGGTFGINLVLYPANAINPSSQFSKSNYASVRCIRK
jgi:hypothetical protein